MDKLLDWDNDRIQRLLRVTDQKDLIIALIGASKEVQEKLFSNMPEVVRNYIKQLQTYFQGQEDQSGV